MQKRPLRVGLDLDGVILYNPARIARPIAALAKKILLRKKKVSFTVPKKKWEQYIWYLLHKSSIFVAPGFDTIKQLSKDGKIEVYIITGRYSFLKDDLEAWLKKMGAETFVKKWFYNKNDDQPHTYKEKLVRDLKLDVFIEDNWDIVRHLNSQLIKENPNLKVFWIYNIFDSKIPYEHKYATLKKAVESIREKLL